MPSKSTDLLISNFIPHITIDTRLDAAHLLLWRFQAPLLQKSMTKNGHFYRQGSPIGEAFRRSTAQTS